MVNLHRDIRGTRRVTDEFYMKQAIRLAKKGEGWVSPNPMVGTVIVREGRILSEGYHKKFGGNHAEINAINNAGESIEGATIYVNLEPCTHYGKTPPCIERIIAVKPARIVIGTADPNPLVSGRGIETLTSHGIETTVGVLARECREINERFFKFIQTGVPFVTLKFAQTIDGRIATAGGQSHWISSEPSLKFVHRLRSFHDAILIGVDTLLRDDPELTVRLVRGRSPLRVIADSRLRTPPGAKVLKNQNTAKTIIATTISAGEEKRSPFADMGIETVVTAQDAGGHVDLEKLFIELGKRNISSVLVEGGAAIITSLLKAKLPDRLVIITAPKIMGKGIEAVGNLDIRDMDEVIGLSYSKILRKNNDLIIDGKISK